MSQPLPVTKPRSLTTDLVVDVAAALGASVSVAPCAFWLRARRARGGGLLTPLRSHQVGDPPPARPPAKQALTPAFPRDAVTQHD
jgi:hypothetical protein